MVKRQTVWLSTMMVLSLMLIGYYTMNNQASPASTTPSNTSATTLTASPTTDNQSNASSNSTTPNAQDTSGQMSSSDNWYNALQSSVNNAISQKINNYQAVIANNSASSSQITSAEKELGTEMSLYNGLQQATEAVIAEGYANAVIEPDKNQSTFTVYVQTNKLAPADAVKVMNVVSQQLDVSMMNIDVKAHQ